MIKRGGSVKKYSRFFRPKKRSTHVDYYIKYNIVNAYQLSDYTKNGRNPEKKEEAKKDETTTDKTIKKGDDSAA